jgi:hypothetical protein
MTQMSNLWQSDHWLTLNKVTYSSRVLFWDIILDYIGSRKKMEEWTLVLIGLSMWQFSHLFFPDQQTAPFQGQPKLLFLSPVGSLGAHMGAQWFHSAPQVSQWELRPSLPFPSCFLCNLEFWLGDCCHHGSKVTLVDYGEISGTPT